MAGAPTGARLPAHDDQPPRPVRVLRGQHLKCLDSYLRALQRLDPAGEHDDRVVPADAGQLPGRCPVPGAEDIGVDAGRHDVDPPRVGVVEGDQLARLDGGVGDQPVRLGDDLLLADDAAARFRLVVVGHRCVLDLGQGVRGVHQRHPPAVLGQVADLPGKPVVRMHDVVVAGRAAGLGTHHPGREGTQLTGQFFLVQPLEGPGHDVPDQHARGQLGDRRLIR